MADMEQIGKPWTEEAEEGYALAIDDALKLLEEDALRISSRELNTVWRLYEMIRGLTAKPLVVSSPRGEHR